MKGIGRKIGLVLIALFALCVVLIANGAIWWGIGNLFIYTFKLSYTWSYLQGLCIGIISFLISPVSLKLDIPKIRLQAEIEQEEEPKDKGTNEEVLAEVEAEKTNIE